MTPAVNFARQQKITHTIHQYQHDTDADSYGLEAVDKLGLEANRVFKTLIVNIDKQLFF